MEIWKDIKGYEGLYQVSNLGNVKSLNYRKQKCAKNLTPKTNNKGYLWVELSRDGGRQCFLIHRLVGEAFIKNPYNFKVINHKDENPKNNRVENLEWCTQSGNMQYYYDRHIHVPRGAYKHADGRKILQFGKNGELIAEWDNAVTIKHILGMSQWSVSECCRGNRKTAYGFIWRYAN